MEARIITNRQQWNEFVAGAEQCNVTQSYEWGQLLKMLDGEVLYVGVVDDQGKMLAALLLLVSRVSVSKSVYFYAPRGPILDDPDSPVMTVLLNYVKALARKYHAFMLKIEPGVADNDPKWLSALHRRGFVPNPEALHLRHEWVLDTRPDEQALLAAMRKTWRYSIRLAGRKDVTIRRGENLADIDTFYRILQATSQRDTFMIYDKSFYEKLVELYGQSQNVALFLAEYEGQALGAALLVKMGRWCWYMYGASSNEHRDRTPNHLLQWTAIRWAKEQGCWYYNFRGIPDVLEESQPMWGVYLFKSGFGGYAMRSLETHDLPYNPILYRLYRGWLDGRNWLKDLRARRANKQLVAPKSEQQDGGEQPQRGADSSRTNPIHGEDNTKPPSKSQTSPAVRPQSKGKQQSSQSTHENESIHVESQNQRAAQQEQPAQIEPQPEPIQSEQQPGAEGGKIEDPKEHMETMEKPERIDLSPESVIHSSGEDSEEHRETSDEPAQKEPSQAIDRSPERSEHIETTDENVPLEPEVQPGKQAREDLEDPNNIMNEETQKIPRIQIAQKHANARRPAE